MHPVILPYPCAWCNPGKTPPRINRPLLLYSMARSAGS